MSVAAEGLTEANLYFLPIGENANKSLSQKSNFTSHPQGVDLFGGVRERDLNNLNHNMPVGSDASAAGGR